ncbi:MAG: bifunctional protein-serine/threonine kinase/phosphatase [Chromatiales bacterium]|nr:bifunctional protein-serine/threonine kinase/phosphatase [Chromatiales bacterium]
MAQTLEFEHALISETGPRALNEDRAAVGGPVMRGGAPVAIAVLSDGISGGEGQAASRAAVDGFIQDFLSTPDSWTVRNSGERVLTALNRWLYSHGQMRRGAVGCTFSAAVLRGTSAHLFHVGDSRIWLLRDGELEQLTHDHRIEIGPERTHLSRALGVEPVAGVDYREQPLEAGDRLIFTSDGVHDAIDSARFRAAAVLPGTEEGARAMVEAALAAGGRDNATALILDIRTLPVRSAEEYFRDLTKLPFPPPLNVGDTFDGYRIERALSASKRSEIFLAQDIQTNTRVVLKAPSVNYDDDPVYIEQFVLEEWVGSRVRHRNVVRYHAPAGRTRSFLFHTAEFIDGQTLRSWMQANPQPPLSAVQNIVRQIASGLDALHRLEMVHRDLKPENIMVDAKGRVKIIDLGSTLIPGVLEVPSPVARDHLVGTENYTAPEFLRGASGNAAADVYSLGVIAYELACGKLPYRHPPRGPSDCRTQYQSLTTRVPTIPVWMDRAIERAVRCAPPARYSTAAEFAADLDKPNPQYLRQPTAPLMERNPLRFWQGIAFIEVVVIIVLAALFAS